MNRNLKTFTVSQIDTNYNEVPTGVIFAQREVENHLMSDGLIVSTEKSTGEETLADFIRDNMLEVVEESETLMTVRSEWGNGEGYDSFKIELS